MLKRRTLLKIALGTACSLSLPQLAAAQTLVSPDAPDRKILYHKTWVVATTDAALRSEPDVNSHRFGFMRPGAPLQVLSYEDDWSYVFNPHTQGTAYISTKLTKPAEDDPSDYALKPAPELEDEFSDTLVAAQDTTLAFYPSPASEAVLAPMDASTIERIVGSVTGEDGEQWYQTPDGYYIPSDGMFLAGQAGDFGGRWMIANLLPTTRVVALAGQTPVRTMYAIRGISVFPTPTGVFSILRRVANETMDSLTLGIPHNSPYGYLVKNVLWTQYFTGDGSSLHYNWWSSNFGGIGSHGCLGLSYADSSWLWNWATIGTPLIVNSR